MWVYDLAQSTWNELQQTGANVPAPRQGHTGRTFGERIIYTGGCDYVSDTCYDEEWMFDRRTYEFKLIYRTKFFLDKPQIFTVGIGATTVNHGLIYFFGGCALNVFCQANFAVYNTTLDCPNNCGPHGKCGETGCECSNDYSGKFPQKISN
jgi:hypothetical protein